MAWRDSLLEFIGTLRAAGMRISVAESLDAMRAATAVGLAQRGRLREALASALLKDEAERGLFEAAFAAYFGGGRGPLRADGQRRPARSGVYGLGGESGGTGLAQEERARPVPPLSSGVGTGRPQAAPSPPLTVEDETRNKDDSSQAAAEAKRAGDSAPSDDAKTGANDDGGATDHDDPSSAGPGVADLLKALETAFGQAGHNDAPDGSAAGRAAQMRETWQLPFVNYNELEYRRARDTLKVLQRRLRTRLARRLRIASEGRVDFRRTVRAAIQHGGILAELRFRNRRPRHLDLLLLGDVSGSMRYAAVLMLELMAGAQELFRHVSSFVYIDSLAEAGFERGHLVTTPPVDFLARSDFGKVLTELWARRTTLVTRASVVVIIGDGRNNRRPPRVEILRDLQRYCRAIIWLNPEPAERWGTGDSAITRYARAVNQLIACSNLQALEHGLARVV